MISETTTTLTTGSIASDGICWFDPRAGKGLPIVWEDGIHITENVEYTKEGIAFILKCGIMFTFYCKGDVLEAKIKIRDLPTCKECLE
jgi:hypothetical protein